jgi:hypothetical protein
MRKDFYAALFAIAAAALLAGCAGSPKAPVSAPPTTAEKKSDWKMIDDKGAAFGVAAPAWITAAILDDYQTLAADSRFNGKTPFVFISEGKNKDLLESWVRNFLAAGSISRTISQKVQAEFEGGLQGKDSGEKRMQEEIVATLSQTEINGFTKDYDWWALRRREDTGEEKYTYLVVYSMKTEDLQRQIDVAMGKIAAQNAEDREFKSRMDNALKSLKFGGIYGE